MNVLFKGFKTELMPTPEQKGTILRTIGVCRLVYNLYIGVNRERYGQGEPFMSGMTFSVWLNNRLKQEFSQYGYLCPYFE